MRCACGAFIRHGQKRCRNCAVRYLSQFDTDWITPPEPPLVLNHKEPGRSGVRSYPKKWPALEEWERQQIREYRKRVAFAITIIVIVFGLAAWALCNG